jgi:hypothetical protein
MTRKLTERERTLNVQVRRLTERIAKLEDENSGYKYDVKRLKDEVEWLRSKLPSEVLYNAFSVSLNGNILTDKDGSEMYSKDDVIIMAREDCYNTYGVDEYPYIDNIDDAIRYFEEHGYVVDKMRLFC